VLRKERRLAILRSISRLPEDEKRIMVYRTQGVGLARIALELGWSVQEVRNGIARAKRALRRDLGLPGGGPDGF
jgi:DNA-directed RNA polymerase specialized sigma24 family protein